MKLLFAIAAIIAGAFLIRAAARSIAKSHRKFEKSERKARRKKSPALSPLTDHSPSSRLQCFPTLHPVTGKKLEFSTKPNEDRLRQAGLPIAGTVDELASRMGVPRGELFWLMSEGANHYVPMELKGRKRRLIFAPKPRLKACQKWILRNILDKIQPHGAVEGFRKGRSVVTHARRHCGKEAVCALDIHRFFDTVRSKRVHGYFMKLGYSEEAALALSLLTTRKGRLPQGAPTSPALANLVCARMDARLAGLAKRFGASYSRYADDMAFSGDAAFLKSWSKFKFLATKIIREEGFYLNPEKTRVMGSSRRQQITGVVVNRQPNINRKRERMLRAIIHNVKKNGIESQNRIGHRSFKDYLMGQISFVQMIRPDKGRRLRADLQSIAS